MRESAAHSAPLVVQGDSARSRRASPGALAEENFPPQQHEATLRDVSTLPGGSPQSWSRPFQNLGLQFGPSGAHLVGLRREVPLDVAPSLDELAMSETENTPAPFVVPPFLRRTTTTKRTTTEDIVTVEEPITPVRAPSAISRPALDGGREVSRPVPKPTIPSTPVKPRAVVPVAVLSSSAPPLPTSKAWERSQVRLAMAYWKEHLGNIPHGLQGKWEGLVREWGEARFRMAMDETQRIAPERSANGKWKLLRQVLRGWRHAEGRTQDWSRHSVTGVNEREDDGGSE